MSDRPHVLVAGEGGRRKGPSRLPPSDVHGLAPILIVAGLLFAMAGWVDVALFYYPPRFGEAEWEFGIIAQTFDAMPLPTLGIVLLALGIRARGGSIVWSRGLAVILAVVALLCLAALVLFALDIPLALKAMQRASTGPNPQQGALMSSGIKRVMAKVILFSVCYAIAFAWMAVKMWRVPRHAGPPISA
jgi:hypothetical protein